MAQEILKVKYENPRKKLKKANKYKYKATKTTTSKIQKNTRPQYYTTMINKLDLKLVGPSTLDQDPQEK